MKYIGKYIILLIFISGTGIYTADAQMNVFYNFNRFGNKIGAGYAISKTFNVDAAAYGLILFDDFSPEFTVRASMLQKDTYNLYLGAGIATNRLFSIVVPVGVEVRPFVQQPKLGFRFDVNIMLGLDSNPNFFAPGFAVCYSLW